ncbi:MAG: hypothetical protein NUV69_04480 [Candidatus Curtissbacteria bacterium]|nr:hypothetical protein [Candidatus Curtissbacteria bacterium]
MSMLTDDDEKKIRSIVNEVVETSTESMRASLVNIEQDRKILKDIWEFVKAHSVQLKDHEERISSLESSSKVS